jgi:hypothetical protein
MSAGILPNSRGNGITIAENIFVLPKLKGNLVVALLSEPKRTGWLKDLGVAIFAQIGAGEMLHWQDTPTRVHSLVLRARIRQRTRTPITSPKRKRVNTQCAFFV